MVGFVVVVVEAAEVEEEEAAVCRSVAHPAGPPLAPPRPAPPPPAPPESLYWLRVSCGCVVSGACVRVREGK